MTSQRSGAAILLLLALLTACGGGGDVADPEPTPAAAPPPAAPAPAPSGIPTCGLPDFQASLLARVNALRAGGADCGARGRFPPAAALRWSGALAEAADGHSRDMEANNYFSHTSLDGSTLADRIDAVGYAWSAVGENIAAGHASVNAVVDAWAASDGHCANLMAAEYVDVGVACVARSGAADYATYWTMDLARPR